MWQRVPLKAFAPHAPYRPYEQLCSGARGQNRTNVDWCSLGPELRKFDFSGPEGACVLFCLAASLEPNCTSLDPTKQNLLTPVCLAAWWPSLLRIVNPFTPAWTPDSEKQADDCTPAHLTAPLAKSVPNLSSSQKRARTVSSTQKAAPVDAPNATAPVTSTPKLHAPTCTSNPNCTPTTSRQSRKWKFVGIPGNKGPKIIQSCLTSQRCGHNSQS